MIRHYAFVVYSVHAHRMTIMPFDTGSCASDALLLLFLVIFSKLPPMLIYVYFCVRLHQLDDAFICHNRFCGDARCPGIIAISNPIKMHENTITHLAHTFHCIRLTSDYSLGKLINVHRKSDESSKSEKGFSVRNTSVAEIDNNSIYSKCDDGAAWWECLTICVGAWMRN